MWSSGPASHGQFSGKAWREQVITRQPAAEKRFTVAWPMPRLAPVRSSVRRGWFEVGIVNPLSDETLNHHRFTLKRPEAGWAPSPRPNSGLPEFGILK